MANEIDKKIEEVEKDNAVSIDDVSNKPVTLAVDPSKPEKDLEYDETTKEEEFDEKKFDSDIDAILEQSVSDLTLEVPGDKIGDDEKGAGHYTGGFNPEESKDSTLVKEVSKIAETEQAIDPAQVELVNAENILSTTPEEHSEKIPNVFDDSEEDKEESAEDKVKNIVALTSSSQPREEGNEGLDLFKVYINTKSDTEPQVDSEKALLDIPSATFDPEQSTNSAVVNDIKEVSEPQEAEVPEQEPTVDAIVNIDEVDSDQLGDVPEVVAVPKEGSLLDLHDSVQDNTVGLVDLDSAVEDATGEITKVIEDIHTDLDLGNNDQPSLKTIKLDGQDVAEAPVDANADKSTFKIQSVSTTTPDGVGTKAVNIEVDSNDENHMELIDSEITSGVEDIDALTESYGSESTLGDFFKRSVRRYATGAVTEKIFHKIVDEDSDDISKPLSQITNFLKDESKKIIG